MLAGLFDSLREFWRPTPIGNRDDLQEFLYRQSAKHSGQLILKYAQKRLGKLHYRLSRESENYAKEIIRCQLELHAQVLCDYGRFLARLLGINSAAENGLLQGMLANAHQRYIDSCPDWYTDRRSYLKEDHFVQPVEHIKIISDHTGDFLFDLLPATENLNPGNKLIFRGQVRIAYISFLDALGKRVQIEELSGICTYDHGGD